MFNMLDTVRVVDNNNKTIKEGLVVEITTMGLKIYDPKTEFPFSDRVFGAEWFPFSSSQSTIVLIKAHKRLKK